MKRIFFLSIISLFFSSQAFAADPFDSKPERKGSAVRNVKDHRAEKEFFFKPFFSIEYSAPRISGGGPNADFRTNNFGKQMRNFENIALGFNIRIHKMIGFNANWSQTDLNNDTLEGVGALSRTAHFKMDQRNFSLLVYAPEVENLLQFFAEAGVADINSKLTYGTGSTVVERKSHETAGIIGGGFQVKLFDNSDDVIRLSFQKYLGELALINSNYTTFRIGYLMAF